jgi:hypothetical protein
MEHWPGFVRPISVKVRNTVPWTNSIPQVLQKLVFLMWSIDYQWNGLHHRSKMEHWPGFCPDICIIGVKWNIDRVLSGQWVWRSARNFHEQIPYRKCFRKWSFWCEALITSEMVRKCFRSYGASECMSSNTMLWVAENAELRNCGKCGECSGP